MASNMMVANAVDIAKYSFRTDSNEDFSLFRRSRSDETSIQGNVQLQTEMETGQREEDRSRENKPKMLLFFRTNQARVLHFANSARTKCYVLGNCGGGQGCP